MGRTCIERPRAGTKFRTFWLLRCHVPQYPLPLPSLPASAPWKPCMPPFATPDIAQHSSGLPHRVPLCQWAEREGTAQLLTTCCHWTHLRRPQNYCVAFSPTLLLFPSLSVSISSLVPSPTFVSHSTIPSHAFSFGIFGIQPPSTGFTFLLKKNVHNQTLLLKKAIDERPRFQSRGALPPRGEEEEGEWSRTLRSHSSV